MPNNTPLPESEPAATPSTPAARPPKKRSFIIAGITVGVLVAAGAVTAVVAVNNYNTETTRLCTVATTEHSQASKGVVAASVKDARAALESATDEAVKEAVPGAGDFSKVAAVEADPEKKVEPRAAAAELIEAVEAGVDRPSGKAAAVKCESREDASRIQSATSTLSTDAKKLQAATAELTTAVAEFSKAEKDRVAAEKKAAEAKAAAEKKAAEERAAAEAAEAAQAAAAQAAPAPVEQYYDPGYNTYTPGNSGGNYGGGSAPSAPPAPAPKAPAPGAGPEMPVAPSQGGDGVCFGNCYL